MAELLEKDKQVRIAALKQSVPFRESDYTFDDKYQPWDQRDPMGIHSLPELIEALKKDKNNLIDIEARCIGFNRESKKWGFKKLDRQKFLEANTRNANRKFREATDLFAYDDLAISGGSPLVGDDFVPLLGGPFNKQLYYYDYLRMHALSFYAVNHDPIARAVVQITKDFTLGRGFRVDCKDPTALAIWRAFEEVNDLQSLMDMADSELSIYGETMFWWLPNNETKITYRLGPGQEPPKGLVPRVRLIDPSVIWDICTYPEDITRVLFYQWVAPTQYQIYTGKDGGSPVPGTKFIYQQIPADQVDHVKINCVSNEKRGRSDLFAVLGYLKRLRDSVNYSLVSLQKQAAWSIDTTIQGGQTDVDKYVNDMESLGTIPPAGMEFAHTDKIKREYLGNNVGGKQGASSAFEWCLSMVAAGTGIPVSYFGTHLSGGQTRASALVATEPVAKRFQMRQKVLERIIQKMAKRVFQKFGIRADIEVTFPEIILQDRSAKLKDIALAETQQWISAERAATMAAKELGVTEFEYKTEKKSMAENPAPTPPSAGNPLTGPADYSNSAVTSDDRKALADNDGF